MKKPAHHKAAHGQITVTVGDDRDGVEVRPDEITAGISMIAHYINEHSDLSEAECFVVLAECFLHSSRIFENPDAKTIQYLTELFELNPAKNPNATQH